MTSARVLPAVHPRPCLTVVLRLAPVFCPARTFALALRQQARTRAALALPSTPRTGSVGFFQAIDD